MAFDQRRRTAGQSLRKGRLRAPLFHRSGAGQIALGAERGAGGDAGGAPMAMTAADTALERQALEWMDDPYGALGSSNTRMHSVPREEAEAVQLAGINLRLEQRRAEISVLAKLAEAQNIRRISRLE